MAKDKFVIGDEGIHDARVLGTPKMIVLGFQHMFAMFGATVLVPLLTGLDVAVTLLMAGIGTLFFHLVTKSKVPAFLGSSFAFLGGYAAVTGMSATTGMTSKQLLPYACIGVACAGLVYLVLAGIIKAVGIRRVMKFFPPVVTGPIIIAIGLGLAGSAVGNCSANWLIAIIALAIVIIFNVWGKGMAKIIPILLGVVGSCLVAAILALTLGKTIAVPDSIDPTDKVVSATDESDIFAEIDEAIESGASIYIRNEYVLEKGFDVETVKSYLSHDINGDKVFDTEVSVKYIENENEVTKLIPAGAETIIDDINKELDAEHSVTILMPQKITISAGYDETVKQYISTAVENNGVVHAIYPATKEVIAIGGNPAFQLFEQSKIKNLIDADWIGSPIRWNNTVFGGVDWSNVSLIISAIIMIIPISLATMMEHIGDISAISSTVGKNFIKDPGLHRTLIGDGVATTLASLVGAPANTTYGENTGVLALSKVYDPRVIRLAAIFAIVFSFSPKFEALVNLIPTSVIGGISFILYGMISAVGVRNVVENKVDFTKSRNLLIAAIILVCALGLGTAATFKIGSITISLSALAVASIAGIVLNAILPGKDYNFGEDAQGDKAANMAVGSNTENYGK